MKRKSDQLPSAKAEKRAKEKAEEEESQEFGCTFEDLPSPIITDILLQLPLKTIATSKCVCKTWNTLISSRYFANQLLLERPSYSYTPSSHYYKHI
ncbi:unnamed protein product [Lathyrus sativus]|nr:unnamed protein product [Lathyrus sativus]